MRQVLVTFGATVLFFPVVLFSWSLSLAQVMESTNYKIQSDSLNTGGGFSSSTNYQIESTVGEVGTGNSASNNFEIRAGYQQMQEVYLSLTGASAVVLGPAIPGVSGGNATGSTTVTVTTDSLSGYRLTIEAVSSPAMQSGGNTIADYVPAGANPDFMFTVGSADAYFGFSPEGAHIANRYRDNGGVCGSGADTNDRCWDGLSTTPVTIASSPNSNHPNGTATKIEFQVGVGSSVVQPAGTYIATTTLTALPL
ncbi:MAG: hypothetical protein AUK16_01215 [Parcubacteria group bacterium CG2_30_44_11]|nr:MAG: hypothetical protein AUK16_01215 [Parcubacteria group bacterium CG2_30_44_11]